MILLLKLFFAFIQVGLFSVGGGYAAIPLIQAQVVNIYELMTMEEFTDLITIAEMTQVRFRLMHLHSLEQDLQDHLEHLYVHLDVLFHHL